MPRLILQSRRQGDRPKFKPQQHPLVRELRAEAQRRRVTEESVCKVAGIYIQALSRNETPRVRNLEALGGALGLKLVWVKDEN